MPQFIQPGKWQKFAKTMGRKQPKALLKPAVHNSLEITGQDLAPLGEVDEQLVGIGLVASRPEVSLPDRFVSGRVNCAAAGPADYTHLLLDFYYRVAASL